MKVGDKCPDFELPDQDGNLVQSKYFIGKYTVIFFYPKDDTPGCVAESCEFRDKYLAFLELNCRVIGVSSDKAESHKKFVNKYQLPYILLSDSKKTVRDLFNVPRLLFGLLPGRVTYVFNEENILIGIYNSQINPLKHIEEALKMIKISQKKIID